MSTDTDNDLTFLLCTILVIFILLLYRLLLFYSTRELDLTDLVKSVHTNEYTRL